MPKYFTKSSGNSGSSNVLHTVADKCVRSCVCLPGSQNTKLLILDIDYATILPLKWIKGIYKTIITFWTDSLSALMQQTQD